MEVKLYMKAFLITVLILLYLPANAQTFQAYKFSIINEHIESRLIELITDSSNFREDKESTYNNIVDSTWENNISDSTSIIRDYWFNYKDILPIAYAGKEIQYPNNQYVLYDSMYITERELLFSKSDTSSINISLDNFLVSSYPKILSDYYTIDSDLYIENDEVYEKTFSMKERVVISSLGKSIFIKSHACKEFFDRFYYDIYEFYYDFNTNEEYHEFLIWFDKNYNLIRIEGEGYGYILIE